MRLASPRRAALTGALIGVLLLTGSPPAQAAATGSITGRLTTSTGAPAANAWVVAYDEQDWNSVSWTETDANGDYTVDGLPGGSYLVSFELQGQPQQYHHRKTDIWDADPVTVTDGATITVNEQLFATGTITGQIRNADGTPRADLLVTARNPETFDSNYGLTDSDGRYRIPVLPGAHQVSFEPIEGSYQTQYVPGQLAESSGQLFEVAEDAEVTVDDTILAVGSLSGRFTNAAGQPLVGAYIDVSTAAEQGWAGVYAETDGNGEFSVPEILVGSYTLSFSHGDRVQFYQGKLTIEEADAFTVSAGANTHLTDSLARTGSVRVTAVDAVTGAPVPHFCVSPGDCGSGGTVTVTDLPQGRHQFSVYTEDGNYFSLDTEPVEVRADQTTAVTVRLRPAARITTTVVDRQTGNPVANVCVQVHRTHAPSRPDGDGYCTNTAGRVTIGYLEKGSYHLFVDPGETAYGAQWVGAAGGTGDQRAAATIVAQAGATVTAPTVRLDQAGVITGRVTDAATGAPIDSAQINLLTAHPGVGAASKAVTDADGRYRVTGLGPYAWPLLFDHYEYTSHWSGGATDRYSATPIQVTAGGTATHDTALGAGTEVRGTVTNQHGVASDGGYVIARHVDTGDIVGSGWIDGGNYTLSALGPQSVYLTYDASFGEDFYSGSTNGAAVTPRKPIPGIPGAPKVGARTAPSTAGAGGGAVALLESPRKPPRQPGVYPVPASGTLVVNVVVQTS
ncbi:carboxypeptidase regulatory-like domain-containing protein [Solwaraspora sp. WMMD1047]|uniref:carboxypeptidase regulatory-like domain-containing protein n=1 Tax=Solwaraspora sp. WMMD1047 TaxID=3016102 RepID=UPI002418097C|nr:carboxypeptidase regulatory-like domain-containing protein [Solwaraspora sp. WMMD1047]MDG4827748.1 carboxypeptidase regulatory-like domain-containing protein [Solwaraspora sp. WMMD1047]